MSYKPVLYFTGSISIYCILKMGEYIINFSITFITKQDGTHGSYERDYLVAESSESWVDSLEMDVVEAATFLLNRLIKKR